MSLLGTAALAMWWDIAPDVRADFEDWHAHEHFPERLGIAGFRRATRWSSASGGEGMFVMYEMQSHAVLSSPEYVARLNAPTAWSTRLMPHHRNMVRSQCMVLASQGGGVGRHALTARLASADGGGARLESYFRAIIPRLALRPGLTGAHLLRHQAPGVETTIEQKIRNEPDQVAEWVFLVCGYERASLEHVLRSELSEHRLSERGVAHSLTSEIHTVSYSATPTDVL